LVSDAVSAQFLFVRILTNVENGGTTLRSAKYHLLPADIRTPPNESIAPLLTSTSPSSPSLEGPLLSPDLPTLLLFECVLVYVTPEASVALIQWFADYSASSSVLGAVVYEMFGLNDSFGNVMVENLKVPFTPSTKSLRVDFVSFQVRGVSLPGVEPYPTFESLPQRFTRHEFTTSKALTLSEIRKTLVSYDESQRLVDLGRSQF